MEKSWQNRAGRSPHEEVKVFGKPIPPRVIEIIEHYKTNLQSDVANEMKKIKDMLDNIKVNFGDDDDFDDNEDDIDINFEDEDVIWEQK